MKKATLPKILVILGPTATGKSGLAVSLAKKYNGEVISADSRQVYTGLDIGTGKITKKEMSGVPHHMIDVVSPKKTFTVTEWQKQTQKIIDEIISRGKLPIICGGTGFYIQSIVDGLVLPEVPPNNTLRTKLEKKSLTELVKVLQKLDPERVKNIDTKNPVRLIRAIEIATSLGKVPKLSIQKSKYEIMQIGLNLPADELKNKIHTRLLERVKKGMVTEAETLKKTGLSLKRMKSLGLEYKYLALFLEETLSKTEFLEKLETEINQYAKRQMTWFKRDKKIHWFEPKNSPEINNLIKKFLTEK